MFNQEKPVLLDVFCGAGGASKGYQQAGFFVIGVDNQFQPYYCGDVFIRMEAVTAIQLLHPHVNAIHASPPCQKYSKANKQWRKVGYEYPDLIMETRQHLQAAGMPYVIENVPDSPLLDPILLNGYHFGLLVHRPRLFESNVCLQPAGTEEPPSWWQPVKMGRPVKQGDVIQPVGHFSGVPYAQQQMGISWMGQKDLSQAIPPAHTYFVGCQLLAHIQ